MKHPFLALSLLGSLLAAPPLAIPALADPAADSAVTAPATSYPATSYHFEAIQQDDAIGPIYEVDFVDSGGHQTPVLQIPAGTKVLSPLERARIIADRLQKASEADRLFWSKLKPAKKNNEAVVAFSEDGDFIMTADGASAALSGKKDPDKFADFLLNGIKTALQGKLRDAKFDYQLTTDEEKIERANLYRQQGDQAYQDKDEVRAEAMYVQATKVAPDYTTAYLSLAGLYLRQGKPEKAQEVLKAGQSRTQDFILVATSILGDSDKTLLPLIKNLKGSH